MTEEKSNENTSKQQKLPQWIEAKLFEAVIKDSEKNFKCIKEFKVGNALAPGENYATVMLKVEILIELQDNTTKPLSFMLKVGHDTEMFQEMVDNHDLFAVEAGMYRDVVPEFEEIYAKVGKKVKFGAKSYQLPTDKSYILLENLKLKGFKNTNRLDGLDMEHAESVLQKLAMWHAASAVRVNNKGPYAEQYLHAFLNKKGFDLVKKMFDGATDTLLDCAKNYKNSSIFYEQLCKLQPQLTEVLYQQLDVNPDKFNVLNHGDCWSNNIMFQYDDEGKLKDTLLVDFQLPRYGTPAQDLQYFILSSTKLEIKLSQFDYMIKYYHDHLVENLKLLEYPKAMPTLKEIHLDLYEYSAFGYMTAVNVMAAVLCDPTDTASLDNFVTDNDDAVKFKRLMYSNARYSKHVEAIFPWLLYRGALEC